MDPERSHFSMSMRFNRVLSAIMPGLLRMSGFSPV